MINNEYALELDLNLDYIELLSLSAHDHYQDLKSHQHRVEHYPYLQSLRNKYPILGVIWNYYSFKPYSGLGIHVDARRSCTLNIPLKGCKNSVTKFYKPTDNMRMLYNQDKVLFDIPNKLEVVFEFELSNPTLIRTDVPHSVIAGSEERLIISWGIADLDFFEAKKFFNEYVAN